MKAESPVPTPAQANSGGLQFLDGLRGLAALYVMAGHARWLLWEGYGEGFEKHPATYSPLAKALVYFSSLFKYGHFAVLFFFVLSGFVIHLRYARRIAQDGMGAKFDWLPFIWRRARRLYPPLLAAMALSFVLDSIGRSCGYAIYRQFTPYGLMNNTIVSHLDGVTALGNLAFLMNTYVPVFGCNTPLWSLKYEWWFYMIYPLFWWLTRRSIAVATLLMAALFAASYFSFLWPIRLMQDVFSSMLAWWLGALLADTFAGRLKWHWRWIALGSALIGLPLLIFSTDSLLADLGMAFLFSALLATGFMMEKWHVHLKWLENLKPLGDMSYTLYVTHFPILVLASGWLMKRSPDGLLPQNFYWAALGILVTLLVAYALHFIVERPFLRSHSRR